MHVCLLAARRPGVLLPFVRGTYRVNVRICYTTVEITRTTFSGIATCWLLSWRLGFSLPVVDDTRLLQHTHTLFITRLFDTLNPKLTRFANIFSLATTFRRYNYFKFARLCFALPPLLGPT